MGQRKWYNELGKAMIISFLLTICVLVLAAFLMYYFGVNESTISKVMIAIYVLAPAIGGFFLGKRMRKQRYLWGALVGMVYFLLFFLLAIIFGSQNPVELFWVLFPMLIGGMAGGMLS